MHKTHNMINIVSKRCIHENCIRHSLYNLPTEKKAKYCKIHKLENMINIISTLCIHENCMMHPSYNIPTEKKALYCKNHKTENMIGIKCRVKPPRDASVEVSGAPRDASVAGFMSPRVL